MPVPALEGCYKDQMTSGYKILGESVAHGVTIHAQLLFAITELLAEMQEE